MFDERKKFGEAALLKGRALKTFVPVLSLK